MSAKAARKPQPSAESSSLLNPDRLKHLYSTMLQCRLLSHGLPGLNTCPTGEEAVLVGCGVNLKRGDYVVSSHPAAAFARGVPLELVIARSYAAHDERNSPLGVGIGLALAYQKQSRPLITLAYANGGPWQESVHYAAKNKLPVVFVVSEPGSGKNSIPSIEVDANDVVAIYRVSQEAIRRAREAHGPTLIVAHIAAGSADDPLEFMEQYLRTRRLWSDSWKQKLTKDFNHELDLVVTSLNRTVRL